MALIDNTFENQSAINDENPTGGALADATGGTSGAGGFSLASAASLMSSIDSIKASLSMKPLGSLFENGKFKFPKELLDKFNLDKLLKSITDAINKNLPFSALFKDGIQGIFSNFLTQLKLDANDTWSFLKSSSGTFLQTIEDKMKGVLLSRIYVPDIVFLAGLYPLNGIKSNVSYNNDYVRNLCLKHDMPLSLAYIDTIEGRRYTVENNRAMNEAIKAARYGSFNVAFYIMRELKREIDELDGCYPLPKKYNRKVEETLRENYKNKIDEANSIIEFLRTTVENETILELLPGYISAKNTIDETTKQMEALSINKEDDYLKDPMYNKIRSYSETGKKYLCKIMKAIIVYSYSNLTPSIVAKALDEFEIPASVFGLSDNKYGQCARINSTDINTMLPIFKPSKTNSLSGSISDLSKKSSLIPDIEVKYIKPRNINSKSIYILLASKTIQPEYMINKDWYERLKLPVYSTLTSSLDNAFSGLLDVGLGKGLVGTIKTIEEAFYIYGKSMEPYLFNPANVEYISYNDLKPLPLLDEEEVEAAKNKSSSKSKSNNPKNKNNTNNSGNSSTVSDKVNTSKAATGTKIDSEVDVVKTIIEYMTEDVIISELKKYGKKDDEIQKMSEEERKKTLYKFYIENNVSYTSIVDILPEESLKKYLITKGYNTSEELEGKTKSQLKELFVAKIKKIALNYYTDITEFMLEDDMKRYLRKYGKYKEGDFIKRNRVWIISKFKKLLNEQSRKIFYTESYEFEGYDAQGFPILGYPNSETILKAISNSEIGSYKNGYPNAFPVTDTGFICPIIGFDIKGKAIYGVPVFYCDIEPIGTDSRNRPVFAYYKDRAILEDNKLTEADVNRIIKENTDKIDTLNSYISNGASGILLSAYQKQISTLEKTINDLNDMMKYMLIKPVVGYDEFGNRVFGETDMIYNVTNPDGYKCIGYDNIGRLIYEYTEEGRSVVGYDKNNEYIYGSTIISPFGKDSDGRLVYGYDMNNKPIYGFTIKGEPVIEIEYDAAGKIKSYKTSTEKMRNYIGKTNLGNPIFEYDEYGNKVIGYDKNGIHIFEPISIAEATKFSEDYEDRILVLLAKIKMIIRKYVITKKFSSYFDENYEPISSESENLLNNFISDQYRNNGSFNNEMNEDESINEWITDANLNLVSIYKSQIEPLEEKRKIYERLLTEQPAPPIIGFDSTNVPILGENLFKEIIVDKPELNYSTESATDYGYKQTEISEENILDKEDFDIDKDFSKVEQELIKNINGVGSVGRIINLVYGVTANEEIIVETP